MRKLNRIVRLMVAGVLMGFLVGLACGDPDDRPSAGGQNGVPPWTRIKLIGRYAFEGDVVEDKDLSGLAFVSERFGLVGADEAREVQVIELSREAGILRVLETVSLARSGSEIDIEGIAADGNCYYIVGSHGLSKRKGKEQDNRYSVFRLKADPATGMPSGPSGSLDAASLAGILRSDPILGEYFGKPLQQKGLNIEGLAAQNGRLFIGFRAPSVDGHAFVMEIRAGDVFDRKTRPDYTLHSLPLGDGLGIREIVAGRSSFLIIAGNSGSEPSEKYAEAEDYEEDRDFFLFTWDGAGSDVHRIGPIPDVQGKAEAMAILEEAEDHVTVLMLFDGPERGRPSIYYIE